MVSFAGIGSPIQRAWGSLRPYTWKAGRDHGRELGRNPLPILSISNVFEQGLNSAPPAYPLANCNIVRLDINCIALP